MNFKMEKIRIQEKNFHAALDITLNILFFLPDWALNIKFCTCHKEHHKHALPQMLQMPFKMQLQQFMWTILLSCLVYATLAQA
jgi:hypothetical protein